MKNHSRRVKRHPLVGRGIWPYAGQRSVQRDKAALLRNSHSPQGRIQRIRVRDTRLHKVVKVRQPKDPRDEHANPNHCTR